MGRWEPDARGRLVQAAMELYRERGFAEATVAEIAARAGLTERTFFRYFADKREVLFWGAERLQAFIAERIAEAPRGSPPLETVATALAATRAFFEAGRREFSRARQALIAAHAELREREVMKMAAVGAAMAGALRARGVAEPAASLVADAGTAIFRVAFERWLEDARGRDFAEHVEGALAELRAAVGEGAAGSRTARPRRAKRPRTAG